MYFSHVDPRPPPLREYSGRASAEREPVRSCALSIPQRTVTSEGPAALLRHAWDAAKAKSFKKLRTYSAERRVDTSRWRCFLAAFASHISGAAGERKAGGWVWCHSHSPASECAVYISGANWWGDFPFTPSSGAAEGRGLRLLLTHSPLRDIRDPRRLQRWVCLWITFRFTKLMIGGLIHPV